jgi:hypothetical protein
MLYVPLLSAPFYFHDLFKYAPHSSGSHAGGRLRHAFIGLGFRERTEAYDFQAALHDHMKYLNKKKTAEEMEQHYQQTSADYSLKDGETLVLQIKNKSGCSVKSKFFDQSLNIPSEEKGNWKESIIPIKPPPPPPAPLSPAANVQKSPKKGPPNFNLEGTSKDEAPESTKVEAKELNSPENHSLQDIADDDFGDFQAAG